MNTFEVPTSRLHYYKLIIAKLIANIVFILHSTPHTPKITWILHLPPFYLLCLLLQTCTILTTPPHPMPAAGLIEISLQTPMIFPEYS